MATSTENYLLVAAFDFGTTYSGYAYSFRNEPTNVCTNMSWIAGSEKLISLKTPTCVLLNPNKEFHSFGFEAENKFASLAEEDEHHEWLLFRRFKMILHNNKKLTRSTPIEDIRGRSMPAMTIFTMSIKYLKDHLLKALQTQIVGVLESDILYVVTVPAIWSDSAKQFMREAAIEAGISAERLKISLEPEAASIWCQNVTTDVRMALSGSGTQYMVVDLGGGTADMSVHEKELGDTLKELHKVSGGPWGGNAVDNNFIQMLSKLFGETAMKRFKDEQTADYFDIIREFETKKRLVTNESDGKIIFRVAVSLKEISEETEKTTLSNRISSLGLNNEVTLTGDKLKIDAKVVRSWFTEPISAMISHVKGILAEKAMRGVNIILLVGGFGESELVQTEMKSQIPNKNIVVPKEAGLAVLKGAVKFGHIPKTVSSRVMTMTYGVSVRGSFDETRHALSKMYIDDNGDQRVDDCFDKYLEVDEVIKVDHEVTRRYTPVNMLASAIQVYCSTDVDPIYVTDPNCIKLGTLRVEHPEGDNLKDKKVYTTIIFGGTELIVKVKIIKTGREFYTSINTLEGQE